MTYLRVHWLHNFEEEPVEMLSELDDERHELRAIERFRDGSVTFAGPDGASGSTILSETAIPSLTQIISDPQFQASEITSEAFERAWSAASISKPARYVRNSSSFAVDANHP
jgi:hypothetical protein